MHHWSDLPNEYLRAQCAISLGSAQCAVSSRSVTSLDENGNIITAHEKSLEKTRSSNRLQSTKAEIDMQIETEHQQEASITSDQPYMSEHMDENILTLKKPSSEMNTAKNYVSVYGKKYRLHTDDTHHCLRAGETLLTDHGDMRHLKTARSTESDMTLRKNFHNLPKWIWVISNRRFRVNTFENIGQGGIGKIYFGELTDGVLLLYMARKEVPIKAWRDEEVNAMKRLYDYSFAPDIYGVFEVDGKVSILMEMINGETLSTWRPKNICDLNDLFRSLLVSISTLHKNGIFHQDLKDSNIMIRDPDDPSSLVIIDFGSAVMSHTDSNKKRALTKGFEPPEKRMTNAALTNSFDDRTKRLLVAWDCWQIVHEIRKTFERYGLIPDIVITTIIGLTEPDHRHRLTPDMALVTLCHRDRLIPDMALETMCHGDYLTPDIALETLCHRDRPTPDIILETLGCQGDGFHGDWTSEKINIGATCLVSPDDM